MNFPKDLKYSKQHEWIRLEGKLATMGITDYAQDQLGDVVMVELPPEGNGVAKDDTIGVVESVKSVSDVFAPLSGKILEVNEPLTASPNVINEDPYGEGWMVKIEVTEASELSELMDAAGYQTYLNE